MEQQNVNNYPQEQYDEIDIMELVRKFLKEWKLVLKWCGVAAVVGVIVAYATVQTYSVSTKMSPESRAGGSSSSLSSLASLAGVNLGNMSSSADAISPDLYPEIVQSVPFLVDLFEVPVEFERKGETLKITYFEYLAGYQKKLRFNRGMPKESIEIEPVNISELTMCQAGVIGLMRKNISFVVDKKTGVLSLTVTDQNAKIAALIAESVVSNLKSYITSYRTEKSRKDLEYYEKLYSEAQSEYFDAQQRYARYTDMNQGMVRQSVMIERERLQNEMQLKYNLYNSCAQQVQLAKAQVQKETPVFVTIQPPTVPLRDNESGAKTLAIFIFLGFCLAALWVLWGRDWIAKLKEPVAEEPVAEEPASKE